MCLREKIGPDPRNFNQRVSLGRNDLLIRTFLAALHNKRGFNRLGCDYLLLTILTGARKEETATLCWREALTEEEVRTTSYVDLETGLFAFTTRKIERP
jgi:hypothetical protein